ncbi:hypothetical protein Vi05172_g6959 [Venturia inaequalis]|nr:hypothetical protein Vi05172_g6959 [Venturia inaequalis]
MLLGKRKGITIASIHLGQYMGFGNEQHDTKLHLMHSHSQKPRLDVPKPFEEVGTSSRPYLDMIFKCQVSNVRETTTEPPSRLFELLPMNPQIATKSGIFDFLGRFERH